MMNQVLRELVLVMSAWTWLSGDTQMRPVAGGTVAVARHAVSLCGRLPLSLAWITCVSL